MTERNDDFVSQEEAAAAAEAGHIGGTAGDEGLDPAQRPLVEGGEGEAEGFEVAESDLIEHAEYTSGEGAPHLEREFGVEAAPDPEVSGEPDEEVKEDL